MDAETTVTEPALVPEASVAPEAATALPTPRVRWAAILWGVAFVAIALGALWILLSPTGLDGYADWLVGLTPLSAIAWLVLGLGALALIAGVAGLARRAQVRRGRVTLS